MKKLALVLLTLSVLLASGCQSAPGAGETTGLPPLVQPTTQPTEPPAIIETEPAGDLIELPGRVYDVPWQTRQVLEEGGYTFTDSAIPVFLYSQEEVDDAYAKVQAYVQAEFIDADSALRYTEVIGIAPDFIAASEYVSPESRKENRIEKAGWAQENYYSHYMDFDVLLYSDNASNWGEDGFHVYNISLYRDDATDPTGWRVREVMRPVLETAYKNLTKNGAEYLEAYRPLTYEELATLGDMGGRVLFATEMLYQDNTAWVYVYLEESNQIVRKEISYTNIDAYIKPDRPDRPS